MSHSAGDYRLLALDLDGTALNTQHRMSEAVVAALRQVAATGMHVVLVSARLPRSVYGFAQAIGLEEPYAALNGALIVSNTGHFLYKAALSELDVLKVVALSRRNRLVAQLYADFDWYVEAIDPFVAAEIEIIGFSPTVVEMTEPFTHNVGKILVMGEPWMVKALHHELIAQELEAQISYSKPDYLEISPPNVTKGMALSRLCEYLQIEPAATIAIGDNYNDVEMLQFAGLGVAMGNAPDEVREMADVVVASNDEDGVARFVLATLLTDRT